MRRLSKILIFVTLLVLSFILAVNCSTGQQTVEVKPLSQYIKPLIGTQGEGNTYPGPVAPFGMVQLSPDTDKQKWATASGYEYSDSTILGFSMQHFSGTGIPDLGDFLFVPSVGKAEIEPGIVTVENANAHQMRRRVKYEPKAGYCTPYKHENEKAECGYYSVLLHEHDVKVELAAADRSGILKFTFPKSDSSNIMIDLSHVLMWDVKWSNVRLEHDKQLVTGYHLVSGWAKERHLYFAARYSKPFESMAIYQGGKNLYSNSARFRSKYEAAAKEIQFLTTYSTEENEVIMVKVGLSAVSTEQALKNLDAEIPNWDFDKVVADTRSKWDKELSKLQIEGTQTEKEAFYTSVFHSFITPMLFEDINGSYRGLDQNIHNSEGFVNHGVFSLWDTYRATHPLFALVQPKRDVDMINSMLAHYNESVDHLLPVWSLNANDTWCMIGYHSVSVISDAIVKGLKGFDYERAFEAMKINAMNPHYEGVAAYDKYGYVPFDMNNQSTSKTLEYAYDDYAIAIAAKKLGKEADYKYFMNRAMSYKKIFDPETQLMRGKDSDGNWRTPFDPREVSWDIAKSDVTEGSHWQYSWYVPHDVQGLINLYGSADAFEAKFDSLFIGAGEGTFEDFAEDAGTIGQYWHGNEPAHHAAYLYDYVGKPWKSQRIVHQVMSTAYGVEPNSLCGNDDCGQMSSWYIFNCMGFYPIAPGSNIYPIGSPYGDKVTMQLDNGKTFTTVAKNRSNENFYIQSVTLNGNAYNKNYITYDDIMNGGELVFEMGNQPNKNWGSSDASIAPSVSK